LLLTGSIANADTVHAWLRAAAQAAAKKVNANKNKAERRAVWVKFVIIV
jgi:hypothetical protein